MACRPLSAAAALNAGLLLPSLLALVLPGSNLSWQVLRWPSLTPPAEAKAGTSGALPPAEAAVSAAASAPAPPLAAPAGEPCPVLALSPIPGAGPLFQRLPRPRGAGGRSATEIVGVVVAPAPQAWPYRRPGVPDVWLTWIVNSHPFCMFRYMPCFATLGEAFWRVGANVAFAHKGDLDAILENLTVARQIGKSPIVIVLGFGVKLPRTPNLVVEFGANVTDRGATLILYNSEPYFYRDKMPGTAGGYFNYTMEKFRASKASEIWDYSRSNMAYYAKSFPNVKARYFPPGAAELLDVGADFGSPDREEHSIAFLGERLPGRGYARNQSFWNRTFRGLSQKPANVGSIRDIGGLVGGVDRWEMLQKYASRYPMQVIYHRTRDECCPSPDPTEAFRLAQLAANGCCIVSQRSFPGDEEAWGGIVHFADEGRLDSTFAELGRDLKRCQTETKARFERRFNVSRLLSETGFLEDRTAAGRSCFTPA